MQKNDNDLEAISAADIELVIGNRCLLGRRQISQRDGGYWWSWKAKRTN